MARSHQMGRESHPAYRQEEFVQRLTKAQTTAIGRILTVAEASMGDSQFKAFKRLVMQELHGSLKPETRKIVSESVVGV